MENKERKVKKVQAAINRAKSRGAWLWFFLILEGLILLIINPTFIPWEWARHILYTIRDFFLFLFWPVSEADSIDQTYRYYIYLGCEWVKSQAFYPYLAVFGKLLIPLFLLLNIAYRNGLEVYKMILQSKPKERPASKPAKPKEKSPRKPLMSNVPQVSGMYSTEAAKANNFVEEKRRNYPHAQLEDAGLWVGNLPRTEKDKVEPDKILPWKNGQIVLEGLTIGKVFFELIDGQAYMVTNERKERMTVGEPMVIDRCNAAGETPADCAVIWLGGYEDD